MFPAFWPSPYSMNTSLYLNSSNTFIDLPVIPSIPSHPPPIFTEQQTSPDDILPELFSSSDYKDTEIYETDSNTTISFEQTTYELLPNDCLISAYIQCNFTCSHLNPAHVQWKTFARQIYIFNMDKNQSIDELDRSFRRHFQLDTELIIYSDQEYFYIDFKRIFTSSNENQPIVFRFNNKHKRKFQ